MGDELEKGVIDGKLVPTVATAENSTTLKVQLNAQKRWKVISASLSVVGTIGLTAAVASPTAFLPGLIIGGLCTLGGILAASASGAEIDEKALEAIGTRVATVIESRKPPAP